MGLGILEAPRTDVPGTVYIIEHQSTSTAAIATDTEAASANGYRLDNSGFKTDPTGQTVLVPQPSDDPNDPLNWPWWYRDIILTIISLMAVIASTLSPLLAADTLMLSLYYNKKFTSVALLTGYQLLGVAVGGLLFVPSSRVWGKRHAFLIGNILCIITAIWGGASNHNYKSLLAARFFQGIALAPFEALVNAVVGDLYFVHERGKRMALTNFCVFGGSFMTPIIVGKMSHTLGWQWTFYFVAIFSGVMFPFMFFFVPEVAFKREDKFNTDIIVWESGVMGVRADRTNTDPEKKVEDSSSGSGRIPEETTTTGLTTLPKRKTFWESLKPFDGRKTDENFFKLALRPFPLMFHPAVFWAMLIQGALIGWTVFLGVILAAVLLGPPLFYGEVKTGYMYTGAFIGAIIGFFVSFFVADFVPRFLTKRNKGIYEPEFRLILVLPMVIAATVGLFGFGTAADDVRRYGPTIMSVFFGFEVSGMVMGAVSSSLYIVDAYRDISIESFTAMMLFKNIFSFALTFKAYDWLVLTGNASGVFYPVGGAQIGVCLLTVPLYIFGKRNRYWMSKHDLLAKCGLKGHPAGTAEKI